ncbi:MAG: 3-keto-5-aminohexanoate cleavage protein [Draconibacterium sp.]|nr:3-keto-5-aminohexanoate cleavage protein [Draconibacterium sp.]
MSKYIINFTPTGMVPTKEMTSHVPLKINEIVEEVLEARKFGVSLVHLHARDSIGQPTWKKGIYKQIIEGIRKVDGYGNDSLIICVSASGRNWPDFERRSECLDLEGKSKPDMASLTLSSLNFQNSVSINSPEMIQKLAAKMLEKGIKPELEAFDSGMVNYAKYLHKKGLIKPPFYFNIILGNIFNAQAGLLDTGNIIAQLPENSFWSLGGIGNSQLKMNITGMLNGGGVRVGLEDNIYFDKGKSVLASNIDLLKRVNEIGEKMELKPYSAKEAREILGLKIYN